MLYSCKPEWCALTVSFLFWTFFCFRRGLLQSRSPFFCCFFRWPEIQWGLADCRVRVFALDKMCRWRSVEWCNSPRFNANILENVKIWGAVDATVLINSHSVMDPWHFSTDPDPLFLTNELRFRILLFPSMTSHLCQQKIRFICILLGTFWEYIYIILQRWKVRKK